MKKLLALLLALVMVLSLVACGETEKDPEPNAPAVDGENNAEDVTPDVTDEETEPPLVPALDYLDTIWNTYVETAGEDMVFMSFGGDYNPDNQVENAPGVHDLGDGTELDSNFGYPADMIDIIGDAAAMRHMLNVNLFSCGAYRVMDENNTAAICDGIYNGLMNRSYMCGAPQWIVIMVIDNHYVVNVFGAEDLVNAFKDAALTAYSSAVIVYDDSMEGAHGDNGIDMGDLGIGIGF